MLLDRIEADLVAALKSGDQLRRDVLRSIKNGCQYLKTDRGVEAPSDELILAVITKEAKKRQESIETLTAAARLDLVERESAELAILRSYLPAQLTQEQIVEEIEQLFSRSPETRADHNRAMRELSPKLKGRADLGSVQKILRQLTADADSS